MNFCTREQERSIKTLIKRFFRRTPNGDLKNLESSISTELGGKDYKLSDFLTEDITKLLEKFGVDLSEMEDRSPSFKSNVIEEIASTEIDDLFHGLTLAKLYFDNYVNGLMVKNYFIGYGEAFLNNDEDLTKNFLRLKGELFNKIQQFLIDNKVIDLKSPKNLYDENFHITDYHHYESIMQYIADYFFSGNNFATIKSYSGKTVPNIDVNMDADSAIYEAYFDMILLSNFDSVLKKDYSHLVKVNTLYYNHLTSTPLNDTYTRVFEPESTMYWSNETHMEQGVESLNVKLVRMIADSIPAYDKSNNKTLYHLQLNDFYLLSSIIANFELLHGHKLKGMDGFRDFQYFSSDVPGRFEWYVNTVKQVLDGQLTNDLIFDTFENYSNIIYSLYNYIHDPELNILEKEKNSDISLMAILGQVINNTFGATYTVNHTSKGLTVQQLYSEDFNNTGINNTVYSKMVANSHAKKFYDLQYKTTADKLNKVFEGIDPTTLAKDALTKNAHFAGKLRRYVHDILGIKLSSKSFRVAMESMEKTPGAKGIFTTQDLKEKLKDMIEGMQDDFTSTAFLDSLERVSGTKFDSTVGELVENTINKSLFKALSKGYLVDTPIKGVMNIKTHSGESIPSYKIPNLTYKDTELFSQQYEYENDEDNPRIYRSLLIRDSSAILGTSTKLELINNKTNKSAGDFTPMENLLGDVNQEFFHNIIKNRKFNVVIGAYSDKSTILQKIIDANFIINGKPIVENSIEEILELVRKQSQYYYHDTVNTVFNAYKELFNIVGINPGTDLSIDNFEASVEAINNILSKHNISDLVVQAQAPHIKITADLHYTRYSDGTFLNNLLLDNYRIFSSEDLFKEFVKRQEQSFLTNYARYNSGIDKKIFLNNNVDDYLKVLNLKKSDYPGENFKEVTLKSGELNPLLQKWLWLNGLFRNEYLYLSAKGEYMHPIKGFARRTGEINNDYWNSYLKESSARLAVMSKRNVAFTSTFEAPIRDSKYGVTTKINLAAISDFQTSPYSITGDKKYKVKNGKVEGGQDAHDGSTWIDYTYSLMIDNSYPAKGYSGTKKQFGTLVTEGGVVIKKDAESVLTNRKILNSTNSSIRAYNLKYKMLSIPITDVELNYNIKLPESNFFNDRGKLYRIGEIQLFNEGDRVSLYTINYLKDGDNWILQKLVKYNIRNLFDLWQAFGGQYSTDSKGNFNEGSNELLYKVMVDNPELKNRLIHVLSNKSALKAGATNLNPSTSFTDNKPLAYATFSSRFMGPQLDASHAADESEIKEVTQIISALAQGGFTSEIAREAYKDIQSIIKETAESYVNNINNIPDYLYKSVTDTFIKSIIESKGNNLAKVLVGNLKKDNIKIPFSNQNFYNAFVKELISKMNTDFISRNYPGLGAVLVPSEGMIQLYDITLPDGRTIVVTQESLIKEALENHDETAFQQRYGLPSTNNYQIFQSYLNDVLPNQGITVDKVEIGDTVEWNGKTYYLNTPEQYYNFKEEFENFIKADTSENNLELLNVTKINNKPRELKPTLHTFNINNRQRNVFDLNGVKLRYYLESKSSDKYNTILNNLSLYVTNKYLGEAIPLESLNVSQEKLLNKFLNLWTQRDLSLMEHNYLTRDVDESTNFEEYFANDDITEYTIEDVLEYYSNNGQLISNIQFRPAELIVSDIFKSKFGRDNISSYDLKKQKSNYFLEKLLKDFTPDKTEADIKINTSSLNHPVYIRFTDDLKRYNRNLNLREVIEGERSVVTRFNDQGERVYNLVNPKYVSTIMEEGKEIILIKKGTKFVEGGKVTGYHKTPNLEKIVSDTIKSFKGSITSLIPLMKPNNTMKTFIYEKENGNSIITGSEDYDFNTLINKQFNKFYNSNLELNENSLHMEALKREALGNIAQSAYASWLKSHDIIAARIPAQSMQSFMPMRVVEYSDDSKNDAFVSISQLWLQGSDFDIDKAYLLGYSFDNRGKYQTWSNLSNFSTKEQIDALDLLPMPTKNALKINPARVDISNFHLDIINNFDQNSTYSSLSPEVIRSFNKLIRYINKNNIGEVFSTIEDPDVSIDFVVSAINRHNTDLIGISRSNSLKNGVVSKINRVISSPVNQLLANSPISIDDWHSAVDTVKRNKNNYVREDLVGIYNNSEELKKIGTINQYSRYANTISERLIETGFKFGSSNDVDSFKNFMNTELDADSEITFSPYDIISYYILQYNASVGKADVGIAANGVKAFFGLTDYYNNFYKEEIYNLSDDEINQSGKIFEKSFAFYDSTNRLKEFNINAIADLQISKNVRDRVEGLLGKPLQYLNTNAALNLSGFLSGATDNAKELLMAKVNAIPDLASMHIYLTILGLEPIDVVEIMTSQVVSDIIKLRESNLYVSEYDISIENVFDELTKKYKGNKILSNNLEVFKELYYASKELSALSGLFGVNQKRKANTWEVYKYLSRLERVFNDANSRFLSKIDLAEYSSETEMTLIGRAVKINPLLVDQYRHMKTVLTNARNIKVEHIDYDGTVKESTVNLMTDGLDFRYYINNPEYKQIAKDYYGLIKHTFNVFDVLDSVPHFAEMVNSLILVHNRLSNSSKKYNFVTNTLKDIINKGDSLIHDFNKSYIDSQVINRGIYFYDTKVIEQWLKTEASDINFRIKDLMKLSGTSDYKIFISNEAKNIETDKGISPTIRNININDSSNPLLTLDSAHGIAQFKKTFEELILPIIQNKLQSEFTDYLKVESVITPFGTRGSAIVSTFPLQELNNPVFIKQFQKLLNTFNFLDADAKLKGLFTNSVGKELKIRDLFFIYNLITNNERYGNKRLTPILENYMQESDSLGYKYIKYWSDHEYGESLDIDKSDPNWRESFEDSVLFHIANTEGKVFIKRSDGIKTYSINNPQFTLISDIALTREQETYRRNLYDTLRVIKEKGIIINLKC